MFGLAVISDPAVLPIFLDKCQSWEIETEVIHSRGKAFVFIDDPVDFIFMTYFAWGPLTRFMTIKEVLRRSLTYGPVPEEYASLHSFSKCNI